MGVYVEKIKQNMKDRNITNRYASLMTGWSIEKVNNILSGSEDPVVSDIEFLAAAVGYNIPKYEQRCDTETIQNLKDVDYTDKVTADKLLEIL